MVNFYKAQDKIDNWILQMDEEDYDYSLFWLFSLEKDAELKSTYGEYHA